MNKNIKLAVAGAVLALSATAANAGIIIPAGEWTVDLSGNVNSYSIWSQQKGTATVQGGLAGGGTNTAAAQSTGLLPNFLSVAGSSRQNDLDVTFLISINPGGYTANGASGGSASEHRQAFMTFGDKSWGSVKIGKDLGIFASDAILNDMTLLGVGGNSGSPTTTTLGGIGTGYMYASWKGQVAYTTPNFNGFQATVGITNPNQLAGATGNQDRYGVEGKASYSFAANDVAGKVWLGGFSQKVQDISNEDRAQNARSIADTEYLTRELASLRIALGDVATRDYLRNELGDMAKEIVVELRKPESDAK